MDGPPSPLPPPITSETTGVKLVEKVRRICRSLELDQTKAIPTVIRHANEMMGLVAAGTLPQQADALLASLSL